MQWIDVRTNFSGDKILFQLGRQYSIFIPVLSSWPGTFVKASKPVKMNTVRVCQEIWKFYHLYPSDIDQWKKRQNIIKHELWIDIGPLWAWAGSKMAEVHGKLDVIKFLLKKKTILRCIPKMRMGLLQILPKKMNELFDNIHWKLYLKQYSIHYLWLVSPIFPLVKSNFAKRNLLGNWMQHALLKMDEDFAGFLIFGENYKRCQADYILQGIHFF